jgi:hypothetical protein
MGHPTTTSIESGDDGHRRLHLKEIVMADEKEVVVGSHVLPIES